MKKWNDFQNPVNGRYKLFSMVVSVLLIVSLLWQGVFAMLGTADANADAFALMEAFSADVGDGLHEQRQAAWYYAVRNPAAEGGVWAQFWGNAHFGAAVPTPVPTPTPIPQFPDNVPNPGMTSTFTDSRGIVWRVIAAEGNSRLIMTEHVRMPYVPYNLSNTYARLSQSNLRTALNMWGADNLAPELASRARVPDNVDNDLRAIHGLFNASENEAAGWTSPGGAAAANAPGALFVLSISELHQHAAAVGTGPERIARNTAGVAHLWWLRSPGNALDSASLVNATGNVVYLNANNPTATIGARPALWINL